MRIYKYDFASQIGLISKNINILDSLLMSEKPSPGIKNLYNLGLVQKFLEMDKVFEGVDPDSVNAAIQKSAENIAEMEALLSRDDKSKHNSKSLKITHNYLKSQTLLRFKLLHLALLEPFMQFDEAFERLLQSTFYREREFLGDMKTVLEQSTKFKQELVNNNQIVDEAIVEPIITSRTWPMVLLMSALGRKGPSGYLDEVYKVITQALGLKDHDVTLKHATDPKLVKEVFGDNLIEGHDKEFVKSMQKDIYYKLLNSILQGKKFDEEGDGSKKAV